MRGIQSVQLVASTQIVAAILTLGICPVELFAQADDVADIASEERRVGDDEHKRYFLIGSRRVEQQPKAGFGLIVILPGGSGSADFHPFVKRIYKNSFPPGFLAAQPVAVKWTESQKVVWPTAILPVEKMQFTTEEFVASVIDDVDKQHKLDPRRVFTLSWSSSGPAAYAISLANKKVAGSFIAMSVYQPDLLPPLESSKGRGYFLYHSPDDRVCPFRMAEQAVKDLDKAGGKVKLLTYAGGHGWRGPLYDNIRDGIDWLEQNAAEPGAAASSDELRSQIRKALFIPDPLPPLEAKLHGQFEPEPGIVAERVTYGTQFGLRVPAILYRPDGGGKTDKRPAIIVVNGHGGDKFSWYAFYTGILYARAGAVVLTYDPIGEGERHRERRSGTRAHDQKQEPREMGQRMGGQLVGDVMQAVSYLRSRPDVDPDRIAAVGYSLGSFLTAVAGAADTRLKACVLAGGGNLDGPDGYWDRSKPMCQAIPYQSLGFLGDRPASLYALHASRGPTLVFNGTADSVVGIPNNKHDAEFFRDLQNRAAKLLAAFHPDAGTPAQIFDFELIPDVSHRPFFVTRPVALWLEMHVDFPNWTVETVNGLPETHIATWARERNVAMDRLYVTENREGGTRALGENVPGLSRAALSVFSDDEWHSEKEHLIYESWVEAAREAIENAQRN